MKRIIPIFFLFLCVFLFTGCERNTLTKEEVKFKEEYESLNSKKTDSGKTYKPIFIEEKTGVQYKSPSEIVEILKTGTGIIYLGFPECPWCRTALPVLLDAMEEESYRNFYYLDAREIRDSKHLENGQVITDQEGTKEYQEMLSLLSSYLGPYEGLEDNTIKRIYFPTVIFIKEGVIKGVHIGTVDTQKDPYQSLTDKEEDQLEEIYENYIKQVNGSVCGRSGC